MAEHKLPFGMLGGEEAGAAEEAAGAARADLDPAAAALAMEAAKADPELAASASAYFRKQARLVDIQTEHLHEQREVQLSHLKLRRMGERMKLAFQVFFALLGTTIVLGVLVMAWDAGRDQGLVVEAFSAPPDLAARGLTGQVIAKRVLDHLIEMQDRTVSIRPAGSYSNNWGEALKVEIPETGVSFGEVRQYLHDWIGHQTRISGEVYRTANGISVVARAGDKAGSVFEGPESDLDGLMQKAAEAIYEQTQPYRYAIFVEQRGDTAAAARVFKGLMNSPERLERAWAHTGYGTDLYPQGNLAGSAREDLSALAEIPAFPPALLNLEATESAEDHPHAEISAARAFLEAIRARPGDVESSRGGAAREQAQADIYANTGDFVDAIGEFRRMLYNTPRDIRLNASGNIALLLISDHDVDHAFSLAQILPPGSYERTASLANLALENGDPAAAIPLFRQMKAQEEALSPSYALRHSVPFLALAEVKAGNLTDATALAKTLPADSYTANWVRGEVAAARGDRSEAERDYAEAIRRAPELPQAYTQRGIARLRRGQTEAALADAERAHHLSPKYPDALKLWGDALARKSDWTEALDKYRSALAVAPAWTDLKHAMKVAETHAT